MNGEHGMMLNEGRFFLPLLFLTPAADLTAETRTPFGLRRRLWETSTFDLATLATKHRLHLPYQLMDVLLAHCNLELEIEATTREQAMEELSALLLGLYIVGVSPTIAPFATTFSVNEYSGINSRDSETQRAKLLPGMRDGLTSERGTLEAWPVHLSLHCNVVPEALSVSSRQFQEAAGKARRWLEIERAKPSLRVVREAAQAAPLLSSIDQSLLHIWCAIEALFPTVTTEISFRTALYLAQLTAPLGQRQEAFQTARAAYALRSRIAHGSGRGVTHAEWAKSWRLLLDAASAIVEMGRLPSEDELLGELLHSQTVRLADKTS